LDLKEERVARAETLQRLRDEQLHQFRYRPEVHLSGSPGARKPREREIFAKRAAELQPVLDEADRDHWARPAIFGSVPPFVARVADTLREAGFNVRGPNAPSGTSGVKEKT
jgi:hypothetical protein